MARTMGAEPTRRLDGAIYEAVSELGVLEHASKRRKLDSEHRDVKLRQRSQLEHEIEHGAKILHRALKVGRGFERQKLGRRQKAAKDKRDGAESARLEAEVTALKGLDLSVVAEIYLHKTLLKTKSIASAPAFPPHITTGSQNAGHVGNTAAVNVTARLYNSNPVKTAMPEVLYRIRAILGLNNTESTSKITSREEPHVPGAGGSEVPSSHASNINGKTTLDSSYVASTSLSPEWTGFSDDQQLASNPDDDQELDYSMYDARLAGSSDSDSEDDITSDPQSTSLLNMPPPHFTDTPKSRSSSVSSASTSPPPKIRKPNAPTTASNSTFIPSLMGGYWSGSESAEDDDTMDRNARKNRMGQQARRLLWEKKFGKKANHLKRNERDEGWDPRRGAGGSNGRGGGGGGRGRGRERGRRSDHDRGSGRNQGPRNGGHSSGANSDPVASRVKGKKEEGPLHPSWEAAKRAKEQKKNMAFQGKKIVFD